MDQSMARNLFMVKRSCSRGLGPAKPLPTCGVHSAPLGQRAAEIVAMAAGLLQQLPVDEGQSGSGWKSAAKLVPQLASGANERLLTCSCTRASLASLSPKGLSLLIGRLHLTKNGVGMERSALADVGGSQIMDTSASVALLSSISLHNHQQPHTRERVLASSSFLGAWGTASTHNQVPLCGVATHWG